jgi:hypothetical protein
MIRVRVSWRCTSNLLRCLLVAPRRFSRTKRCICQPKTTITT